MSSKAKPVLNRMIAAKSAAASFAARADWSSPKQIPSAGVFDQKPRSSTTCQESPMIHKRFDSTGKVSRTAALRCSQMPSSNMYIGPRSASAPLLAAAPIATTKVSAQCAPLAAFIAISPQMALAYCRNSKQWCRIQPSVRKSLLNSRWACCAACVEPSDMVSNRLKCGAKSLKPKRGHNTVKCLAMMRPEVDKCCDATRLWIMRSKYTSTLPLCCVSSAQELAAVRKPNCTKHSVRRCAWKQCWSNRSSMGVSFEFAAKDSSAASCGVDNS
mmetsp:Transcript_156542/g.502420  ORF Transcript_156542/g.502420 Transcript_156542/m.502420 type:complete len:272 (+) Transcript_156542:691-1506(+)